MEKQNLKEVKRHGTENFKVGFYYIEDKEKPIYVKHHWHDEIELIHLKKGKIYVEINMDKFTMEEECFIFINREELHYVQFIPPFKDDTVVFDMNCLNFSSFDYIQSKVLQPLTANKYKFPSVIKKSSKVFNDVKREFENLSGVYKESGDLTQALEGNFTDNVYGQIRIKTSLLNIIGILYDSNMFINEEKYISDYRIEYIKKIIVFVQNNYGEKIKISDLSEVINMNEQYFCRFFKSMIGKSPMEYVNEYRIKKSEEMLLQSDKKIVDIAMECGFNNMGNFIRLFKKFTGSTPLKYKNNIKS